MKNNEIIVLADFPNLIDLENKILSLRKKVKKKKIPSKEDGHITIDCSGVNITSSILQCLRKIDLKFLCINVSPKDKKLFKSLFIKNVVIQNQ
jgi:hypothetical protein